ncbi:MAG TPA: YncE family protein [Candidatus Angelobacter sp.]|nr:YncE family protein [Candidatus Angelobacter sp.]
MQRTRIFVSLALFVLSCALCGYAAKLRQVAMIDLPGDPGFNQVAIANGQVVISRPATNTVEIFSPAKRRVIARISQIDDPRGIAVDDKGFRVYIALGGSNRIAVVNSRDWQVEKLIPVTHRPEKLLWVAEANTLYVTSILDRTLSLVVPVAGREGSVVDLDGLPEDLAYDSARHALLLTLQDLSEVATLDRSGQVIGRFKLAASEPTGMVLDNARRRLYVAVRYAVVALNADTGAELARVPAPGGTSTLALDSDSNLLYAAAGDGSVLAIDLNRNTVDHELPTDVKGYSLAYDPVHKMLFMPGGREGRSKMVVLTPISLNVPATAPVAAQKNSGLEQTAQK